MGLKKNKDHGPKPTLFPLANRSDYRRGQLDQMVVDSEDINELARRLETAWKEGKGRTATPEEQALHNEYIRGIYKAAKLLWVDYSNQVTTLDTPTPKR